MDRKKIILILALIVFLGTFLRFYKLGEVSFVADEFLDINASYGYFKTGDWQAWNFNLENPAERINVASDERAWIYRWQAAQLFNFFPPTEAVARSVSAAWGVLAILIIFLVARDLTKKNEIGFLSAFLFAVSVSGITFGRHFRMYAMFFPVFLLFSWTLFKFLESDYAGKNNFFRMLKTASGLNFFYAIPAAILAVLSFHLHPLTANIVPIAGIYIFVQALLFYKNNKIFKSKYAALAALKFVGLVLIVLLKPESVEIFLGGLVFFENHWNYFLIAFNDYSLILMAILILAAGIWHLLKKEQLTKETLWLALSFFVPLLMSIFLWRRNIGEQYLFFAKSFLIILIASGIYAAADFFRKNLKQSGGRYYVVTIVLLAALLPNYAYFFQKNNTYQQNYHSENPNYRSVFIYFKKHRLSNDVLITRNFRNYYWSGEKVKTFDFGGELSKENFKLADLQKIMSENPSGWFVYSKNDENYIAKDAQKFVEKNLEKINALAVRGDVSVYRWENNPAPN